MHCSADIEFTCNVSDSDTRVVLFDDGVNRENLQKTYTVALYDVIDFQTFRKVSEVNNCTARVSNRSSSGSISADVSCGDSVQLEYFFRRAGGCGPRGCRSPRIETLEGFFNETIFPGTCN